MIAPACVGRQVGRQVHLTAHVGSYAGEPAGRSSAAGVVARSAAVLLSCIQLHRSREAPSGTGSAWPDLPSAIGRLRITHHGA